MRILALHGMTLNGATMRRQMGPLRPRLEELADVEWLDAPQFCPPDSVQRHYSAWGMPIPDGPHLRWWDASSDGHVYAGWNETLRFIEARLLDGEPPVLFGFSQGAVAAAAVALFSTRELLPPIAGAVLVAGFVPRAEEITRHFTAPLDVPSLHVWGTEDPVVGDAPERLMEWFAPERRTVLVWPGSHSIPRRGPFGETMLEFLRSRR